jgi:alpha-glucosidase
VVRHPTRYGGGPVGRARARAATLTMLALPGSAYVYQGEELGLPEILDLPDELRQDPIFERTGHKEIGRDGCRVPIPWSGTSPPYGFGPEGSQPWLPQPDSWARLSVGAQAEDHTSMLLLYRNALALRRFIAGEESLTWIDDLGPDVLAFHRGDGFICVVNFAEVPAVLPEGWELLLASDPSYVSGAALAPDTAAWLRG